jgi:glyoxylase-like metal-dependent hydrolase (beta-lactamase superfamily II)
MGKAAEVWKPTFMHTRRVFDPITNDLKRFEYGKELLPGITAVDARGHSPGHASFVIASGNAKLLYIADTTNHPVLFARNPEWHLWADMDKPAAVSARKRLLDMAAADRLPIAGYHYPFPAVGYIEKRGSGYNFVPAPWLHVL